MRLPGLGRTLVTGLGRLARRDTAVPPSALAADLARRKREVGVTVSVCLPARNEAATVGGIVHSIYRELVAATPLVDELIVIDDGSVDATAEVARRAGAVVVAASELLPSFGPTRGKGDVLWRSLAASTGDIVVWCDADLVDFDTSFVSGLLAPLLGDESIMFVKGYYERRTEGAAGGGRVTELMAKPLIALLRPDLAHIRQPLGGEYAGRRELLEQLAFDADYGVETGLLLDVADTVGVHGIAQVDLGVRRHRNRPLHELAPQAASVARSLLRRCPGAELAPAPWSLLLPDGATATVDHCQRPPLRSVRALAGRGFWGRSTVTG